MSESDTPREDELENDTGSSDPEIVIKQVNELAANGEITAEDLADVITKHHNQEIQNLINERAGKVKKRSRPDVLNGISQRIDTGHGKLYVTINEDESGEPFELFANIGSSGGFTGSFTEALGKTISTALRCGVDPNEIVEEIHGVRSPKIAWDKGEKVHSIPDAIGLAIQRYLDGNISDGYPQQRNLDEIEDGSDEPKDDNSTEMDSTTAEPPKNTDESDEENSSTATEAHSTDQQKVIDAGENPECPSCGALALYYSEGCKTCESCGWSEC